MSSRLVIVYCDILVNSAEHEAAFTVSGHVQACLYLTVVDGSHANLSSREKR